MKPDFPKCKDTETARSLISQMKGEVAGRKPSTYRESQSPKYDVPDVGKKWVVPKVVGGATIYRGNIEDCRVGDRILCDFTPFRSGNWVRVKIHYDAVTNNEATEERLFKRVDVNGEQCWHRTV